MANRLDSRRVRIPMSMKMNMTADIAAAATPPVQLPASVVERQITRAQYGIARVHRAPPGNAGIRRAVI